MPGRNGYDCKVEPVSKDWSQEFGRLADEGKSDSSEVEADSGRKGSREMSGSGAQVQIGSGLLAG